MTDSEMTLERLRAILEGFGARPERWPEDERQAAEALCLESREAEQLVSEARRLDGFLDLAANPAKASEGFVQRLLEIPANMAPELATGSRHKDYRAGHQGVSGFARWFRPSSFAFQLSGLAVAGTLGLLLGFSNFNGPDIPVQHVDASAYLFENPDLVRDMEAMD